MEGWQVLPGMAANVWQPSHPPYWGLLHVDMLSHVHVLGGLLHVDMLSHVHVLGGLLHVDMLSHVHVLGGSYMLTC